MEDFNQIRIIMPTWSNEQLRIHEQTQAVKTAAKCFRLSANPDTKAERELHDQIEQWLRMKGVRCIVHSRMDKKTTQKKGVPDFLFVMRGNAFAIEVKVGNNQLTKEQEAWLVDAAVDGWICRVVRSLDQLICECSPLRLA